MDTATRYSKPLAFALAIGGALCAVLIWGAARAPYFPGDVALARMVQRALPYSLGWARQMTAAADPPACFGLLGLAFVGAWIFSGWRAALLALPIFFGLWLFGLWLSPVVAQPRPSPVLIHVPIRLGGHAFPSISALVYVATFGYLGLLGALDLRGLARAVIALAVLLILMACAAARLVLGAHWPSDLWVAYLMGLVWIGLWLPWRHPAFSAGKRIGGA
ncbi:MAG TPA: phosphatase PAP2 family protein [Candidatus Binataceae bacterium]|nr:phosphatase PAP2 family protein [Candidatus Binataceae bacterium]